MEILCTHASISYRRARFPVFHSRCPPTPFRWFLILLLHPFAHSLRITQVEKQKHDQSERMAFDISRIKSVGATIRFLSLLHVREGEDGKT